MEQEFATMEHPTPKEHRGALEKAFRSAAIESATLEQLDEAIEKVKEAQNEGSENPIYGDVLKQLEDAKASKKTPEAPPTLH